MLVYLAHWFDAALAADVEKITFRAALSALASFLLAILIGPRLIRWLRARFREPIKCASEHIRKLHEEKQWTPTMGGLFIVAGLTAAVLIFGDWSNPYLPIALVAILGFAAVGAIDDLVKLRTAARGISARAKLSGQILVATIVALLVYRIHLDVPGGLALSAPSFGPLVSLGWWFVPLAVLVMVGASNAVNLTDGLDGLAGGCWLFAAGAMSVMVYASGHREWAQYLHLAYLPHAGELLVVAAGALGGVLGFLWFNCHPAAVFMGDTGSLPLGGLLGLLAVVARQEILLVVVAGVFVVEAVSVVLQVLHYRHTGRRLFRCAPLHHHFQLLGWPESQIVVRFWIAAALCALLGLSGLKLGSHEAAETQPAIAGAASTSLTH